MPMGWTLPGECKVYDFGFFSKRLVSILPAAGKVISKSMMLHSFIEWIQSIQGHAKAGGHE